MNKEQLLILLSDTLGEDCMIKPVGFVEANHKPHQFRVGAKHQLAAEKENKGVLTEEICQRIRCEQPYCNLKYEEHTYDKELVLQLTRDAEQADVMNELVKLKPILPEHNITHIKFAEVAEYKFLIDGRRPDEDEPQS